MNITRPALKLTHVAAMQLLADAIEAAENMGVPQCIAVVDEGCNLLAYVRMDGARILSQSIVTAKAMTAATICSPTGGLPSDKAPLLAQASGGKMTNLPGGLPLVVAGQVVGGIGVGSGTSEQDLAVAEIAVAAFNERLAKDYTQ